ncbi:MAG: hypothetical protein AAF264_01205 [Pseudomonadota bacterium]
MIRPARFTDIPEAAALLQNVFDRSHYASGLCGQIDTREVKRLLANAIQRHGGTNGGATWVQVAEADGVLTGLIVGTLARVYGIGTHLMATDLFWVASPDVEPRDPAALMRSMIEWAKANPHVVEIKCGTTAVVNDDPKEAGRVLERLGLSHYGEIYRCEVTR